MTMIVEIAKSNPAGLFNNYGCMAPQDRPKARIGVQTCLAIVARLTNISPDVIAGNSRAKKNCRARQLLAWLAVAKAGLPLTIVGRRTNRDHSSILHNKRRGGEREDLAELRLQAEALLAEVTDTVKADHERNCP